MRAALQYLKIVACFIIVIFPTGVHLCSFRVCLTWRISVKKLTLVCKVDGLHLSVFIDDPLGHRRADCFLYKDEALCDAYYKNESITQNPRTHEIVYTWHGQIDNKLNGNWTCKHGSSRDVATVEVTVLEIGDLMRNNCTATRSESVPYALDLGCTKSALLWTIISYFVSVMICMVLISTRSSCCSCQSINDKMNSIIKRFKRLCSSIRDVQNDLKFISVYKKISFIIYTATLFCLVGFLNLLYTESCQFKFVCVGLGVVFGIISSFLFLNNNDLEFNSQQTCELVPAPDDV